MAFRFSDQQRNMNFVNPFAILFGKRGLNQRQNMPNNINMPTQGIKAPPGYEKAPMHNQRPQTPPSQAQNPMPQQGFPQMQNPMPQQGFPQMQNPMPQQGFPQMQNPMPQQGFPQMQNPMPQQGFPHAQNPMPQQGFPQMQNPMPQQGFPQMQNPMPQQGFPHAQNPMPQQGFPHVQNPMPQQGFPQVQNPMPQQANPSGNNNQQDGMVSFEPVTPELMKEIQKSIAENRYKEPSGSVSLPSTPANPPASSPVPAASGAGINPFPSSLGSAVNPVPVTSGSSPGSNTVQNSPSKENIEDKKERQEDNILALHIQNEKNASDFYKHLSSKATDYDLAKELESISKDSLEISKTLSNLHKINYGRGFKAEDRKIANTPNLESGLNLAVEYENKSTRELVNNLVNFKNDTVLKELYAVILKKQCTLNTIYGMNMKINK